MFEAFPLVQQHLEYVLNGGDSQQFMRAYDPTTDFDKLDIPEENVRLQKSILTDYFTVKGHDKDFISELLEDYEYTGKLFFGCTICIWGSTIITSTSANFFL